MEVCSRLGSSGAFCLSLTFEKSWVQPWTLQPHFPVRPPTWVVHPAHCSLPRMKLTHGVKPTLISGNATQLHMEHKSFNTPLITHNNPEHHAPRKYPRAHSDGSWDVYLGPQGSQTPVVLAHSVNPGFGYSRDDLGWGGLLSYSLFGGCNSRKFVALKICLIPCVEPYVCQELMNDGKQLGQRSEK